MLRTIPYKVTLPISAAGALPVIAHIVLSATGSHLTPQAYLLPITVGFTLGMILGCLMDKYQAALAQLKASNTALQKEVKERTLSEARYAALFNNNHSVTLLIDPTSGNITDANRSASAYYGYPTEQLKRMNISEINLLTEEEIHAEMTLAAGARRKKFHFQHRLRSGEIRDVEVYSGSITVGDRPYILSIVNDVTELKTLRGILPICAQCKKIRDDQGYWNLLETYIEQHSEADFSHGICPDCTRELYPELLEEDLADKG